MGREYAIKKYKLVVKQQVDQCNYILARWRQDRSASCWASACLLGAVSPGPLYLRKTGDHYENSRNAGYFVKTRQSH